MPVRSKTHHFVPQILQKRFCFKDNLTWYSRRRGDGSYSTPELIHTKKAFCIDNYYSIIVDEELSDSVERKFYGNIDNFLGEFIPAALAAIESNKVPRLSQECLNSARRVIFEMIKRTPDFVRKYDDVLVGKDIITAALSEGERAGIDADEQADLQSELRDSQKLKELGRSVRVQATIKRSERVESALDEFEVKWAISKSRHSFILSSMMAYRIGNGGSNGLASESVEIWMPISPKVSLVLLKDKKKQIPSLVLESADSIRKFNEFAVRNSSQIASHSQSLIESLTGNKSRYGEVHFRNSKQPH